jgi:tetratricopeptide (TPR) repeat protein
MRASPFVNRATLRRDLGNTNQALEDFAKAISINPRHAGAYRGRDELYLRQKNYARAISDFDHALQLAPTSAIHMLRAQARDDAGDLDRALTDYRAAERLDPKSVAALTAEGGIWRKKGDLDKAIAAYDRALATHDRRPATYKLRAEAYAAKGERKRAMADIGRALKFTWNVDLLKTRAALRLDDGDMAGVVHDTDAILKADANNADALALRGAALARKKDYVHALADLDKAIAADEKNALALGERGQVYLAKGDANRALTDFNRAIALGSISPAPYRARHELQAQGRHRQGVERSRCHDQPRFAPGRAIFRARRAAPSQRRDRQGARRP